jgi:spermidine/putrescine transport system ATP-binding protein
VRSSPQPVTPNPHQGATVLLEDVSKTFSDLPAVDSFGLEISEGEFVSLLGPSGCGKTTLLRIIAGFETPDRGRISVGGVEMTRVPPNKRPVNLVFQRATLFPHLTVEENVAFGLKLARVPKGAIATRVAEALTLVRLPGFEKRDVETLSGGEAQRVALARALVNRPKVLLLDEPLGALDLQIRRQLQVELKEIHRTLGTTFVFVTHDQEEAMTMSDRIVVMNEGRISQTGTPREIYRHPQTLFTARFVGSSNLWEGTVQSKDDEGTVVSVAGRPILAGPQSGVVMGQAVWVVLRPESLEVRVREGADSGERQDSITGVVADTSFLGSIVYYRIDVGHAKVVACRPAEEEDLVVVGDEVVVEWNPRDLQILVE